MILALSVVAYVLVMIPIGLYASRKVRSTGDYVLAGRSLPFYMALATVFATWFGSESVLGASTKFAEGGFGNVIEDPFGAALCLIIAGIFFNRKLYNLSFLTIGDYFKSRYNTVIAVFLSVAIIISYFGWVAAQLLALGLVLSTVIPALSLQWAILFAAALVTAYTFFGGMYSVATLDTIQVVVIIVGLGAVLAYALSKIGGFDALVAQTPPEFWNVTPQLKGSLTEWIMFVTALMTIGFGSIPQQDVYQRAMSAKSATVSVWASVIGGLLYFSVVLMPLFIAGAARILYPEVLAENPQNLVLTLIQDHTPLIIQVLFFGALVSAIISTASGALLAPGTLLAENVIKPFFSEISDRFRLHIIRIAVIVIACGGVLLALRDDARIYELVSGAYSITLVAGFIPLAVGLYSSRANSFGALMSIVAGLGVWQYWEHVVQSDIPSTFMGFLASALGMLIGTIIGTLIRREEKLLS
jgi:solute:Na+ symporter, SSS family